MPQETDVFRVAAIRETAQPDTGREVLFLESSNIFDLPADAAGAAEILATLQQARQSGQRVEVVVDTDLNHVVSAMGVPALEMYNLQSPIITLEQADPTRPIDADNINPGTFNIVGDFLKSAAFDLCTNIVPDWAEAVRLFNVCVSHSCNLGAPAPCIPFQYLKDGCYARAHRMRYLIEKEGYCCEKAFAFAMTEPNKLSVRASKWGNCCVSWWWHVAPMIRVKMNELFTVALVIDPGIFDRPVLFSNWLSALEDKGCYPQANVVTYSIQAGSAYGPNDLAGTTYTLDDDYSMTNTFLNKHPHDITCPPGNS